MSPTLPAQLLVLTDVLCLSSSFVSCSIFYIVMDSAEKFSFKFNGHPITAAVHTGNQSFLSCACVEHVQLCSSVDGYNAALSVLLPGS